ncbi:having 3 CCCH RNA binding domains involved in RNA metabolism [Cryptosporidium bovis]|uniref:having 3 CCCH RNA binding domains involved in RNA metabolism n=1 Tax=Cryptosporidium bovis TaxID=310047 RepID=UPI003519E354|nr:having 3 CCCH RNA binding domains involved in RNA metabolism [Cryptosporidium bovis]
MANALLSIEELTRFRTKLCKRSLKDGCDFGPLRCQYSHNVYWPRRCPFYLSDPSALRYIPDICPDITILDQSSGKVVSMCNRGGYCPFAHSMEEVIYHPLRYKTEVCTAFQKGECKIYYCHLIHGLAERRPEKNYTLPFTKGVDLTKYPNVTLVDRTSSEVSNMKNTGFTQNQFKTREFIEPDIFYNIYFDGNKKKELPLTNTMNSNNSHFPSFFDFRVKSGLFPNSDKTDYSWNNSLDSTYNSYLLDPDPCSEIKSLVFKWRRIIENPELHLSNFNFNSSEYWETASDGLKEIIGIINTLKTIYCKKYYDIKAFDSEIKFRGETEVKQSNYSSSILCRKNNITLIGGDQEINKCTVSTENSNDSLLQPQLQF